MDNGFHMIGLYVTFIGAVVFFIVMPFAVIKYVRKKGRHTPDKKEQ